MYARTSELDERVVQHFGASPDELEDVPDFVYAFVDKLGKELPDDTEVLFEAAEPEGDPTKGGHGYGIATCTEDGCMLDLFLTADPELEDGGKSTGLGSIEAFKMHCMEEPHIAAREKRLRQDKRKVKANGSLTDFGARPSMAQVEQAASQSQGLYGFSETDEDDATDDLPRPRWAAIGAGAPSDFSETENEDDDVKPVIPKPAVNKGKGKAKANDWNPIVLLSSDEDDDFPIRPVGIKRRRDLGPHSSIGSDPATAIQLDSDEDVKPVFSSTPGSQRRKQKQMKLDRFYGGRTSGEIKIDDDDDATPPAASIDHKPTVHDQLDVKPNVDVKPDLQPPQTDFFTVPAGKTYEKEEARLRLIQEKNLLNSLHAHAAPGLRPLIANRRSVLHNMVQTTFKNSSTPYLTFPSRTLLERIPGLANIWKDVLEMWIKRDESERKRIQAAYEERLRMMQAAGAPGPPGLPGLDHGGNAQANAEAGPSRIRAEPAYPMGPTSSGSRFNMNVSPGPDESLPARAGVPLQENELAKFFEDALDGFAEDETVAAAATKLGLASMDEALPSMQVKLMPHQVIGVAWMLDMERNPLRKGGILADSMGLGKTIQMIATMAENQSEDRKRKTTLIIAPVALLEQWEQEIRRFVKHKWRIHLYHGKGNKISLAQMKQCDIILTSFGQVANALPSEKPGPNDDSSDDMNKRGDLLRINFWRVVVDEASQIRNSRTKGAKAIYQLKSIYRWILSGTLVVNTLVDLFSPLYFLNISELSVWENFRDKVKRLEKRRPDLAVRRVQAVLKYACKRRTADSKIDGQPILTLPPKTLVKRMPAFDQDERTVYDVIEARAIARFNKFLKANTVLKNYAHVLTMILRLRQICNHVSLVCRKPGEQGHADDLMISNAEMTFNPKATEEPGWNREAEIERARTVGGDELVNKLIQKFMERQSELEDAEKEQDEQREEDQLADIDMECAVCFEPFGHDERVTVCCHSFCVTCIELVIKPATAQPVIACPLCREPLHAGKVFVAAAFKPVDDVKEEEDVADNVDLKLDINLDEKMPPSTKMIQCLELIKGWIAAGPTDKIIIFSQFVTMIDILDDYLRMNGVDTATYTGQMSKDDRDEVLADFKRPEGPKVLIISTKAGGVGLNLTCANKVILLDHTWTYAATAQAVDRAWRIGQIKPVEVIELSIENTIEARILALQEKKKQLADGAFGEGGNQKLGRLSLQDLRMLFDRNA